MVTSKQWKAPGPGRWEQDVSHQSSPFSRYGMEMFRYFDAGFSEASPAYGLLFKGFTVANLDGWFYVRQEFVEDEAGVMRAEEAAAAALRNEAWRLDGEAWYAADKPRVRARLLELQSVDLARLNDRALAKHLNDIEAAVAEGFTIHFRHAISHWLGVGRWVAFASELLQIEPSEALQALKGASPASVEPMAYLDAVAAAVKASPEALAVFDSDGEDAARLAALRDASADVATALDAYLTEHGARTFTGFDLLDETLSEMPGALLASIRARLSSGPTSGATSTAEMLRARVPAADLETYDHLFETAQLLYGVRDDDVGPTFHWPAGLLRLALKEGGRRLVARGLLGNPILIFEATPEEATALLRGEPSVAAVELERRLAVRLDPANASAPPFLGDGPSDPPPLEELPPAIGEVMAAFMTAMFLEMAEPPEQTSAVEVKGTSACRGVYEGIARVVSGAADFHRLQAGDVLIAPFTTPVYNVVLPLLGAVVTNQGGILSHAAIVAREYGLPAIVGTGSATSLIPDGARVRVDGDSGVVTVLSASSAEATAVGAAAGT